MCPHRGESILENSNKIKGIILAVVLLIASISSAVYGKSIKTSFQDNVEFNNYLKNQDLRVRTDNAYPYDADYDLYGAGEKIHTFDDLQKKSDVIVKAKLTADYQRKIYRECIFSEAEVLKCYKGNLKKGQKLHMFEPVNCTGFENPMLCEGGYMPMINNDQYYLFLMKVKNSHFSEDQYVYLPISLTYGKYKADQTNPRLFRNNQVDSDDREKLLSYSQVKNQEVLLCDKHDYKKFLDLKKKVLKL